MNTLGQFLCPYPGASILAAGGSSRRHAFTTCAPSIATSDGIVGASAAHVLARPDTAFRRAIPLADDGHIAGATLQWPPPGAVGTRQRQ